MILKKLKYLSFILLIGCGVEEPKLTDIVKCPSSEDFSSNDFTYSMNAGEKVANRFNVNGITTGTINLSSLRLFMSTDNITSVNIKVYLGDDYRNPDYGTLLNSTTVNVTSNNSNSETPVDIILSSVVPLKVETSPGTDYFIVISPLPGAYDLNVTSLQKISKARIDTYTGSWNIGGSNGSGNVSMKFNYSGCVF